MFANQHCWMYQLMIWFTIPCAPPGLGAACKGSLTHQLPPKTSTESRLCLGLFLESITWPKPKMYQGSLQQFKATGNCQVHSLAFFSLLLARTTEYICGGRASVLLCVHVYKMPTKMLQGTGRSQYHSSPESFRGMEYLSKLYLWLMLSLLLQDGGAFTPQTIAERLS